MEQLYAVKYETFLHYVLPAATIAVNSYNETMLPKHRSRLNESKCQRSRMKGTSLLDRLMPPAQVLTDFAL